MLKYSKIIDEDSGLVVFANGDDFPEDFTEMEIQQSDIDNKWYISEKCPLKSDEQKLFEAKNLKLLENTQKAKQAVENGYVVFKGAKFETNSQTVSDLTATMLMLQASGVNQYNWLSKDDKIVELSLEDFTTLGLLIANYKNTIWNEKYISFKNAIENTQNIEDLNAVNIDYEVKND